MSENERKSREYIFKKNSKKLGNLKKILKNLGNLKKILEILEISKQILEIPKNLGNPKEILEILEISYTFVSSDLLLENENYFNSKSGRQLCMTSRIYITITEFYKKVVTHYNEAWNNSSKKRVANQPISILTAEFSFPLYMYRRFLRKQFSTTISIIKKAVHLCVYFQTLPVAPHNCDVGSCYFLIPTITLTISSYVYTTEVNGKAVQGRRQTKAATHILPLLSFSIDIMGRNTVYSKTIYVRFVRIMTRI